MILELVDEKHAFFSGNSWSYKNLIKVVPGATWNGTNRRWEIPIESVQDAKRVIPSLGISEVVQGLYKKIETRNKRAVEVKTMNPAKASGVVKGLKGTLRPYQAVGKVFLDSLQQGEGSILAFDMGLGKSLTSLATFLDMKNRGLVDYCLVICPAPLKYSTWEKEVQKWTNLEYVIVDGDKPEIVEWEDGTKESMKGRSLREIQYLQWQFGVDVIVMNYELFLHDTEVDAWDKVRDLTPEETALYFQMAEEKNTVDGRKPDSSKGLIAASKLLMKKLVPTAPKEYKVYGKKKPCLAKRRVQPNILPPISGRWCVILDEAHRIKSNKSSTTKSIFNALRNAGIKIPMSGTPLENNIQELWSIVDLCRPGMLGSHFKFVERYCEKDYWGTIVGPKVGMMQELKDKLAPIMIRMTKEEALPDLPELTIEDYWVSMTPEQTKLYAQVKEGILQNMETKEFSYIETLAQLTRLQQLLDSPRLLKEVLGDDNLPIESGKLNELSNLINDIGPKKFVLFSQYKEMTDILYNWLIDSKILPKDKIGYIHGGMQSRKTAQIQDGFQQGDVQCVLMTTAGNYGIELNAGSYVICYDELFNPQKMSQIYSRVHRSGVKNAVIAINLMTRGTYEENKVKILEGKKELFNAMIDGDDVSFAKILSKEDFVAMM